MPVGGISKLTEHALRAALSPGDDVIAVSVHPDRKQSSILGQSPATLWRNAARGGG